MRFINEDDIIRMAEQAKRDKYQARFKELYELSRVHNPEWDSATTVAYIREVMIASNDLKFDWDY